MCGPTCAKVWTGEIVMDFVYYWHSGARAAAHMWCALWVLQSPPISTNNLFIRYLRRRNVVVNHRCMVVVKMVSQMQRALFLKAAQLYLNRNVIYLQLPGLVTITQQCGFMM